jgi:hypothetical protein
MLLGICGIEVTGELKKGGVVIRTGGASCGGTIGEGDEVGVGVGVGVGARVGEIAGEAEGAGTAEDATTGDTIGAFDPDSRKASGSRDPLLHSIAVEMMMTKAMFTRRSRSPIQAS